MLHKFRIKERESEEIVLIQIHHEQLVSRRQIQLVARELLVEVADIFTMFLYARKSQKEREREKERKREREREKREKDERNVRKENNKRGSTAKKNKVTKNKRRLSAVLNPFLKHTLKKSMISSRYDKERFT